MSDKSEIWRKFYIKEQAFYELLNKDCDAIYGIQGFEAAYIDYQMVNSVIQKPPRYVRQIFRAKDSLDHIYEAIKALKATYKKAAGKSFKKYPARFPIIIENADRIVLFKNDAYSSLAVKSDSNISLIEHALLQDGTELINQLEKQRDTLRANGFRTAKIESSMRVLNGIAVPVINLTVNTDELFSYFDVDAIQARKHTGFQYRANVRRKGSTNADRYAFGLFVMDRHSDPVIYNTPPSPKKKNALENTHRELHLPIATDYTFWAK